MWRNPLCKLGSFIHRHANGTKMSDTFTPNRRTIIAGSVIATLAPSVRAQEEGASGLFTGFAQRLVPADVDAIVTRGHSRPGIGAARYRATARTGATAFRACVADGRWFELDDPQPDVTMFGALVDDREDDTVAWHAAIAFAMDRGVNLVMPQGNSRVTGLAIFIPAGRTLSIQGAGKLRSAIVPGPGTGSMLVAVEAADIDVALKLCDLAIVDPAGRQDRVGLSIRRCARFALHNIRVAGWKIGIEMLGALVFEATGTSIVGNAIGRRFGKSAPVDGTSLYPNLVTFEGGEIRDNRIGTLIEGGNQILDSRIDVEANGVAGDIGSGAVVIEATMGEEVASRGRRDDGPCQYVATGCWFEQNKGQTFAARGAVAANIVIDRCTFVANEAGRDIAVEGVGGISLLDTMCMSPGSVVSLGARMERIEGGLYAGTLHSTSAAATHCTRVAALDRAGWMTSHRLWHRDVPDSDLAWFTDKEAANGSEKDSTAWKYGDGRVRFRHGAAGGRASLILAPDAIGFLDATPKPRQRVGGELEAIADSATRTVLRELIGALEAFGLVERGPPKR